MGELGRCNKCRKLIHVFFCHECSDTDHITDLKTRLRLSQEERHRLWLERETAYSERDNLLEENKRLQYGRGLVQEMADRGAFSMSEEVTQLRARVQEVEGLLDETQRFLPGDQSRTPGRDEYTIRGRVFAALNPIKKEGV